jgi:hypothetical protein
VAGGDLAGPGDPAPEREGDGQHEHVRDVREVAEEQQPHDRDADEHEAQPQAPGGGERGRRDGDHREHARRDAAREGAGEPDRPHPAGGRQRGDQGDRHRDGGDLADDEQHRGAPRAEPALAPAHPERDEHEPDPRADGVGSDEGAGEHGPRVAGGDRGHAVGDRVGPRPVGDGAPERPGGDAGDDEQQQRHRRDRPPAGDREGPRPRRPRPGRGRRGLRRDGHRHGELLVVTDRDVLVARSGRTGEIDSESAGRGTERQSSG